MGSESSGFEQTPRDVVGQVPEAEGGAAQVFEPLTVVDGVVPEVPDRTSASLLAISPTAITQIPLG